MMMVIRVCAHVRACVRGSLFFANILNRPSVLSEAVLQRPSTYREKGLQRLTVNIAPPVLFHPFSPPSFVN